MSNTLYTDQKQVTGYLGRELTEREATIIQGIIQSASDYVDGETSQSWGLSADGVQNHYHGGESLLVVDPIYTLEAVEYVDPYDNVLFAYTENVDFISHPLNRTVKTQLEKISNYANVLGGALATRWPSGRRNIRVTAKWGQDVPADIQLATTMLTAKFLKQTENIKIEMIEGYRVEFFDPGAQDAMLKNILQGRQEIRL